MSKKLDSQNLHAVIQSLPQQFLDGYKFTDIKIPSNTKKIFFAGMGGSALPANLLKTYLSTTKTDFPASIKINRDYHLPRVVDKNWCGFFSSYSGNTEEVLTCLKRAEERGLKKIVVMAHAGQLKEIAQKKHYDFVEIPDTEQPRMSYGFYVGALLRILVNSKLIDFDVIAFEKDIKKVRSQAKQIEKQAQVMAKTAKDKTVLVYATNKWKYLAMVWKINFNENAKTQSFWNAFPEMNHNEMVGFTNLLTKYKTFIINDPDENSSNIKRAKIFTKLLGKKLNVENIEMPKGSEMLKMVTTLQLGLWTSYYLALLYRIDPAPVDLVEKFKKLMQQP
mgnify:CR=1 FL=1